MAQKGGLTPYINKGRYGCAASIKFRPGKFFQINLVPGQKVTKPYRYQACFREFQNTEIRIFNEWATLGLLFNQMLCIFHFKKSPKTSYLLKPDAQAKIDP